MQPNANAVPSTPGSGTPLQAMAWIAAGALAVALMTILVRYLGQTLHPFVIVFYRSILGVVVVAPLFARTGLAPLRRGRVWMLSLYGLIGVGTSFLCFTGFSLAPVAKATALSFSMPLFASAFALVIYRESIRVGRLAALVLGFVGTVAILRPDDLALDSGALFMIAGSMTWATSMILLKTLARTESGAAIAFYVSFLAIPFSLVAALPVWQWPTVVELVCLIGVGLTANLSHVFQMWGLHRADMTAVLPIDYTRLVWAAVIGYIVFAEVPEIWTWIGGTAIVAAATYLAYLERRPR